MILDYDFIKQVIPLYLKAAALTVHIALWGVLLSSAVGLLCALVRYIKLPFLTFVVSFYTQLSRNTPLLIQLFFLYFALPKLGVRLSSEQCAVIGLSFLGGSYMAETFRASLETVPATQVQSAFAVGLKHWQIMIYVILPQAFSVSVPGVCANIIFLIKETSVFSAVALADLMFVAKDLIGLYYKTDEALLILVVCYFVLLLPISIVSSLVQRRLRHAQFGSL